MNIVREVSRWINMKWHNSNKLHLVNVTVGLYAAKDCSSPNLSPILKIKANDASDCFADPLNTRKSVCAEHKQKRSYSLACIDRERLI